MNAVKKYSLLVFLIENLLAQAPMFGKSSWLFYLMLATGLVLLVSGGYLSNVSYRQCKPLHILAFVYIAYQFTLGFSTLNARTVLYLLAKVTTFVIIGVSIMTDWDFYARKVPVYLSLVVALILLFGINSTLDLGSGERMNLGFGNPNSTSSLSAFALVGVLFFYDRKRPFLYITVGLMALYAMLAGGGRNAILTLAVASLIWTGGSMKKGLAILLMLAALWGATTVLSVELSGVSRIKGTIDGSIGSNRDIEREAAIMMIEEKPITGWGFEAHNTGNAAAVSDLGSHNGYLETIKFMGYPFGGLFFVVLILSSLSFMKYYKSTDLALRYHLAIVLSTLVSALYEGLFVGVHEFSTNMVFYSLAVLSVYNYSVKHYEVEELTA